MLRYLHTYPAEEIPFSPQKAQMNARTGPGKRSLTPPAGQITRIGYCMEPS